MAVKQVEETELLGDTLDCKDGERFVCNKEMLCFYGTHSKKQVLQALVLSYLDYCPVVWSNAARNKIPSVLETVWCSVKGRP